EFDLEKDWWGGYARKGRKTTENAWKVSAKDLAARNYNLDCKNPHEIAVEHGDPDELMAEYLDITRQLQVAQQALKTELLAALKATDEGAAGGRICQSTIQRYSRISNGASAMPRREPCWQLTPNCSACTGISARSSTSARNRKAGGPLSSPGWQKTCTMSCRKKRGFQSATLSACWPSTGSTPIWAPAQRRSE